MALIDLSTPDPQRNRRNGLITALVVVFYLVIIVKCSAQPCVKRTVKTNGYEQTIRTEACNNLTYGVFCPKLDGTVVDDTMFVGIYADKDNNNLDITIYVIELKGTAEIVTMSLEIQLENNRIEKFYPIVLRSDLVSVYSEYKVTNEQYLRMKTMKYKKINFIANGQNSSIACPNGYYFSDFLKQL